MTDADWLVFLQRKQTYKKSFKKNCFFGTLLLFSPNTCFWVPNFFIINNFFGGTPNVHVNVRFTTRSTPFKLYEIFLLLRNFVCLPTCLVFFCNEWALRHSITILNELGTLNILKPLKKLELDVMHKWIY